MYIGMLWFDNDPKATLDAKIARAVEYYENKYGKKPNLCFVHPSMLSAGEMPIEVRGNKHVRPNHFWIGMNNPIKT